jgi:hypothetical protein
MPLNNNNNSTLSSDQNSNNLQIAQSGPNSVLKITLVPNGYIEALYLPKGTNLIGNNAIIIPEDLYNVRASSDDERNLSILSGEIIAQISEEM